MDDERDVERDPDRDLDRDLELGRATALSSSTGFFCKLCTKASGNVTCTALIYYIVHLNISSDQTTIKGVETWCAIFCQIYW